MIPPPGPSRCRRAKSIVRKRKAGNYDGAGPAVRWATSILALRQEWYQPFGSENLDALRLQGAQRQTDILIEPAPMRRVSGMWILQYARVKKSGTNAAPPKSMI